MIWQGTDREGTAVVIDQDAWLRHVLKHPEIKPFLDAVVNTIIDPDIIFPDTRPSEQGRYFRRLYKHGNLSGYFSEHFVRVAIKYVKQTDGLYVGFYSSSWFQRQIQEPHIELERIRP